MFTSTTSSVLVRPRVLIKIGEATVFADRIDGFTDLKRVSQGSSPDAEFLVLMSSGEQLRIRGEEKKMQLEQEHLLSILEAQQDPEDEDHPQGQSG